MAGFLVMTIPGIFRRQEKDPAQEQEISALTEEFFPVRGSSSFNQELDMAPGGKQHQAEGPHTEAVEEEDVGVLQIISMRGGRLGIEEDDGKKEQDLRPYP